MSTVITIIAIIAGPILAVQAQKIVEFFKLKHEEKRKLFMTLMSTRGRPLVLEHVQALNMIDVIFSNKGVVDYLFFRRRKRNIKVVEAWSELRDHLYNAPKLPVASGSDSPPKDNVAFNAQLEVWAKTKDELLVELLAKMAESLNYHFDKVILKRGSYTPQRYGDIDVSQEIIHRGLTEVFLGLKSLPISIVPSPKEGEEGKKEKEDSQDENLTS